MTRHDDTYDPKNPPDSVMAPHAHSAALPWFVGALVAFFLLIGVALVFWNAANPQPSVQEERESAVGTSGYYSTEGGHDPIRRPKSTRDELKFRGSDLTQPGAAPRR
jgi:hypothetical protein